MEFKWNSNGIQMEGGGWFCGTVSTTGKARMTLLNHTCPNCGGTIQFEPGIQKVTCLYCRSVFDPEVFRPKDAILDEEQKPVSSDWDYEGTPWHQNEQAGMQTYKCRSCGAEIIAEVNQGTSTCIFCRKPTVITSQFSGTLRPDIIIPFKLRKEEAEKALEKHYLKKRLLPKAFKDENHISEIKGVYIPFWLFDAQTESRIVYDAQKVRTWSDSKNDYKETSYYRVDRAGSILFGSVPVDGSSVMDDALTESIEPYRMQDSVDFQTVYLTGYFASRYDVDAELCFDHANERIRESVIASFAETLKGYTSTSVRSADISLTNRKVRYALLPAWVLTTTWKDKEFLFVMNGQTGALAGDLPLDKSANRRWFWGILLGVTAAVTAAVVLLWIIQGVFV